MHDDVPTGNRNLGVAYATGIAGLLLAGIAAVLSARDTVACRADCMPVRLVRAMSYVVPAAAVCCVLSMVRGRRSRLLVGGNGVLLLMMMAWYWAVFRGLV